MIEQVRMWETYSDSTGVNFNQRQVFAFGTHADATTDDQHPVTSARVLNNNMRVIMDELLVGNNLEEIACRDVVDDDAYSRVPIGATPDDIAKCALPTHDALLKACVGDHTVCICNKDGGCGTTSPIAKGEPVGVLDVNQDGAADDTRFIDGAVGITCAGMAGDLVVPIDLDNSYWNPSGTQQVPATGGFDALGPAVVLSPLGVNLANMSPSHALPSNADCHLTFADDVVDKQGNKVCAPPNGDITQDCTPGDVSAFKFTTEPLRATQIQGVPDMSTDVPRDSDLIGVLSAPIAMTSLTGVSMTENGMAFNGFTVTFNDPDQTRLKIHPTAAGGFAAMTDYTITFTTAMKDLYGQALPTPVTFHFTTGM